MRHGKKDHATETAPPPHLRRFTKLIFFSFVFRNSGGVDTAGNRLEAPCILGFQGTLEDGE
ncbi:MAG: hypothetical protein ACI88H_001713 [Cocleimonas sp.]|jgi:hypothetical protein